MAVIHRGFKGGLFNAPKHKLRPKSEYVKALTARNCELIKGYVAVNRYLLKLRGETMYRFCKNMHEKGVYMYKSTLFKFGSGEFSSANLFFFAVIADYHNKTIPEMLELADRIRSGEIEA